MGMFEWLFGKKSKAQKYMITTKSGSTYVIERAEVGTWIIHRPNKGQAIISHIGKDDPEHIQELTQAYIGEMIYFYSRGTNIGNTSAIKTITKQT